MAQTGETAQAGTTAATQAATQAVTGKVRAWLYDACGHDHEISADAIDPAAIAETQLVWIDAEDPGPDLPARLAALLGGDTRALQALLAALDSDAPPAIEKYAGLFTLTLELLPEGDMQARAGFAVAEKWLISLHRGEAAFLSSFREQDKAETVIGLLSPPVLLASLLDWHLDTLLAAVARIEESDDRLDQHILNGGSSGWVLRAIVAVRRRISALRRTLGRQRQVFHALPRADLLIEVDEDARSHFERLSARFDRVADEVEHAREVLIGSFELFASLAAQSTNELVKVLTFTTVVIGVFSAVAGLLGMNFRLAWFETGLTGFVTVVAALLAAAGAALWYARRRGWI
ncbi:MAG TPA: CorA family divalent cation transporter [Novosphingobium sp.]|nr:CorA family divalent cation transporter [Novosphingobium sp.]